MIFMKTVVVGLRRLFDVRDSSRMWVTGWKGEGGGKERVGTPERVEEGP